MLTTPVPALAALAGVLEALEAIGRDATDDAECGVCWLSAIQCDELRFDHACPGPPARAALAAWRTRLPMAEDGEFRNAIIYAVAHRFPNALNPKTNRIADDVLAALDARMGKP